MKILLTGAIKYSKNQINQIKHLGLEVTFEQDERNINSNLEEYDIIVGNGIFLYNDIKKFKNLKMIQLTSAGLDRVPLEYIKQKNIKLYNARGVYSIPMAEWTILKILEIYKNTKFFVENQKNKNWQKERNLKELTDKKVTIVGYGSVGEEIAKRLKAFNTYITAVDVNTKISEYIDAYKNINELGQALEKSDIVILTLPLNENTENLFNEKLFMRMKNDSLFINISRGKIVNQHDLVENLKKGKFLGAILDVFEEEPLNAEDELWNFENVIITPHNSFIGENNNKRMFDVIMDNLKSYLKSINN